MHSIKTMRLIQDMELSLFGDITESQEQGACIIISEDYIDSQEEDEAFKRFIGEDLGV